MRLRTPSRTLRRRNTYHRLVLAPRAVLARDVRTGYDAMNHSQRLFVDPDTGERYWVRIARREGTDGRPINPLVESLVFETEAGERVGTVPVYSPLRLHTREEWELKLMLERAQQRGP